MIGVFSYLANKQYFEKGIVEYYMSYEDCEDYLRYIMSNPAKIDEIINRETAELRLSKCLFGFK
jgi:hypothetical protein